MKSCPNCKQQEVKPLTSKQLGLYLLSNTKSTSFCSSFTQTALIQAHSSHTHVHCDNVSLGQLIFHQVKCGQLMAKLSQPMILCKAKEEWYLPAWLLVPGHKEIQAFPPAFSSPVSWESQNSGDWRSFHTPTSMQSVTPHSVGSHFPVAKAGNQIAAPAPCSRELEEAGEAWWVRATESQLFLASCYMKITLCSQLCPQVLSGPKCTPCILISNLLCFPIVWSCGFLQEDENILGRLEWIQSAEQRKAKCNLTEELPVRK